MVNDELKRDLIAHKIYSAWQFIKYTEKNIAIVCYCAEIIDCLIKKMSVETLRWEQDMVSSFVDDTTEDRKKVKRLSMTTDNVPTYEVRVVGEKVDPWFLFDKLLRDFFQYAMNSFDSISQIINAGLLANRGKKVDSVDIQAMVKCFEQQMYSAAFPQMHAWLDKISQSKEYQYIEAINNRTKHTADIANKLSMGILGNPNTTQIGSFYRRKIQHDKKELARQLQVTLDFLTASWDDFLNIFRAEYANDIFSQNRRHEIAGVRQQKYISEPDQNLSYAYINVEDDFESMPEELYILLVKEDGNKVYSHECPFNIIFVTGDRSTDVLGRYLAEDSVGDDSLLHYRKYVKDNATKGFLCMYYARTEDPIFYRKNPYFKVESFSDDEQFLISTDLPY